MRRCTGDFLSPQALARQLPLSNKGSLDGDDTTALSFIRLHERLFYCKVNIFADPRKILAHFIVGNADNTKSVTFNERGTFIVFTDICIVEML